MRFQTLNDPPVRMTVPRQVIDAAVEELEIKELEIKKLDDDDVQTEESGLRFD